MEVVRPMLDAFWSDDIWLPPNITWTDIEPGSRLDVIYPDYRDLIWTIPIAFAIILFRYSTEKYLISPIGQSLNIKHKKRRAPENIILETAFNHNNVLDKKRIVGLSKQVDFTERQIERWWRIRKTQNKQSTLVKFCENSWRCFYYTLNSIFGLIILWNKPWFWSINECWYTYPHQSVTDGIWWYYMISMGFYLSVAITQFFDIKRSDFLQMFIHHILTLLLLSLSWICNLHRVGTLVLLVHDIADIFLEGVKVAKYANYQKLCDFIFVIFTVIWIATRLGFYPRIIYSTTFEASKVYPIFPVFFIFNTLLILLLGLHIMWTYIILKMAYRTIQKGKWERDIRSSTSDSSV